MHQPDPITRARDPPRAKSWGAARESGESGHHARARAVHVQYANFSYWDTGKTRTKKTVGWESMYITMGTAVYGYISYEFLGLVARPAAPAT